jgi:hypothetical protein
MPAVSFGLTTESKRADFQEILDDATRHVDSRVRSASVLVANGRSGELMGAWMKDAAKKFPSFTFEAVPDSSINGTVGPSSNPLNDHTKNYIQLHKRLIGSWEDHGSMSVLSELVAADGPTPIGCQVRMVPRFKLESATGTFMDCAASVQANLDVLAKSLDEEFAIDYPRQWERVRCSLTAMKTALKGKLEDKPASYWTTSHASSDSYDNQAHASHVYLPGGPAGRIHHLPVRPFSLPELSCNTFLPFLARQNRVYSRSHDCRLDVHVYHV